MTTSQTGEDVIDVLVSDHREVTALIEEIWAVRDPMIRRDLTDTAISELVRHAVAEEMYVYPAMRKYLDDGEKEVQHDINEHQELEETMKTLEAVDVSSTEFDTNLRRLQTMLADHVQDEESEQFPQLRRKVPAEDLQDLADKVETAKKLAPTRPHPGAPNSEVFHKLVGPGVGLVDRLRDKLTGRATKGADGRSGRRGPPPAGSASSSGPVHRAPRGEQAEGDHAQAQEQVQPVVGRVERHEVGAAFLPHDQPVQPEHQVDRAATDQVEPGVRHGPGHRDPGQAEQQVHDVVQDGHLE